MGAKTYFRTALTSIRKIRAAQLDTRMQDRLKWIEDNIETGIELHEEEVLLAKQLGLRNPDFDGDWIGRPDDDFKD